MLWTALISALVIVYGYRARWKREQQRAEQLELQLRDARVDLVAERIDRQAERQRFERGLLHRWWSGRPSA